MRDLYENYHTETIEGFEVSLRFEDEDLPPADFLDDERDLQAVYNGDVTWLCAVVEVRKCGIQLGYTTLGAITYKWDELENFIKDGFYEMAQEAIDEAKMNINKLAA